MNSHGNANKLGNAVLRYLKAAGRTIKLDEIEEFGFWPFIRRVTVKRKYIAFPESQFPNLVHEAVAAAQRPADAGTVDPLRERKVLRQVLATLRFTEQEISELAPVLATIEDDEEAVNMAIQLRQKMKWDK